MRPLRRADGSVLPTAAPSRLIELIMIACREFHEPRHRFCGILFSPGPLLSCSRARAVQWVRGVKYRLCPWQPCPLLRIPWRARTMGAFTSWMRSVTTTLKEALTALADVLAKRPAEEILFDWFRSGRLVGELSVLIKRRHPEVQAEIDRVYREHLAKLGKRRRDPAAQDYGL